MCSAHRQVVALLKASKVKVIIQGQGHLKGKYSDSNSYHDFAQNLSTDGHWSWHHEVKNDDHFFLGQLI